MIKQTWGAKPLPAYLTADGHEVKSREISIWRATVLDRSTKQIACLLGMGCTEEEAVISLHLDSTSHELLNCWRRS